MNPAVPHHLRPQAALAMLSLVVALGLSACSRSTHPVQSLTAPVPDANAATVDLGVETTKAPPIVAVVPALAAPSDGATDQPTSLTLSWNAALGASSYQVQVSTSAQFQTPVVDRSNIRGTSTAVSSLESGTTYFWRARARFKNRSGSFSSPFSFSTAGAVPPPPPGPPPPPPPPPVSKDPCASFTGLGGAVSVSAAEIPQFRPGRLRIELTGDVAAGTIDAMGKCTASTPTRDSFISGIGDVHFSGSSSATATGNSLSFGALLQVPGEDGIVLATDAAGNVLEVIWPGLAGSPAGPPILRLELAAWNPSVIAGSQLDADITLVARAPDGTTATFTAHGASLVVPPLKTIITE